MSHSTDDVYGISREIPLNYVERGSADAHLVDNLSRNKHIVIYGSSKQGKTCLRKHCLTEDDSIMVQCSNKWEIADLHAAVLKRAGFEVAQSSTKTVGGKNKILAKFSGKIFGIGAAAEGSSEEQSSESRVKAPLELDIEDVNDVIAALDSIDFGKYIALEDFHYLPTETQKDFAVSLKAFHEASSYCFIIVGVWLEENRLIVYNGDLAGRVVAIDADKWTDEELRQVIDDGAALLNISFSESIKRTLLERAFESVYIVQEVCQAACRQAGVASTQETLTDIGGSIDVEQLVKDVVNQQSGRYMSFITQFADGFQDTALQMYRWLLFPVLRASTEQLTKGLTYADVRKALQDNHPNGKDLNLGNLTQALQSTAALQVKKNIKPIILDYDQTNRRLGVVDRGFLIWLENQDRALLLEAAGLAPAA